MTVRRRPAAHRRTIARHRATLARLAIAAPLAAAGLALGAGRVLAGESTPLPSPTPLDVLFDWSFDPQIQLPVLGTALLYLLAVRQVNARHPGNHVPRWQIACFLGGLAAVELALQGVVDRYEGVLFTAHMVQHLLLMMVAAPLLVAGAPITLVLRVSSPRVRVGLVLPILHSRVVRLLSHPIVAWTIFTVVLWGSHFSPLYELALESDPVHYAEHAMYLAASLLFWWPIVGTDPSPWRLAYPVRLVMMMLQMVQGSFLGLAVMNAPLPLYPHYAAIHLGWVTPLGDQQLAGAVMWGIGGAGFLAMAIPVFFAWLADEEEKGRRSDAREDREAAARARLVAARDMAAREVTARER